MDLTVIFSQVDMVSCKHPINRILLYIRCPACKHFAPIYEAAAQEIEASVHSRDILISRADCATETVLCNRFSVKGYPTVLFGRPSHFLQVWHVHSIPLLVCRATVDLHLANAAKYDIICRLAGWKPEAS